MDGIYAFEYYPATPGKYIVTITWGGQNIPKRWVKSSFLGIFVSFSGLCSWWAFKAMLIFEEALGRQVSGNCNILFLTAWFWAAVAWQSSEGWFASVFQMQNHEWKILIKHGGSCCWDFAVRFWRSIISLSTAIASTACIWHSGFVVEDVSTWWVLEWPLC